MPERNSEDLLARLELFGMHLGLENIRRRLAALGDPHTTLPVVLIAGTNGKGSSAALLATICQAAGYCTGLYTSPHLEAVTERLSINGTPIADHQLASYLERSFNIAGLDSEPPTYFEALTIAAFLHFRDAGVDLAVMEVGLGGRLDATNIGSPELSIITSISLDHEQHLGTSRESIAAEKCGILRVDRPALAWAGDAEIRRVLSEQAAAIGSDLAFAHPADVSTLTPAGACPQQVRLRTPRDTYTLELSLPGRHQLASLSLAVRAAEILGDRGWPALDAVAIARGTARCRWPGRLEWIALGDGRHVLLDAAHNAAGLEALVDYIDHLDARPDLLFGALTEKSIDGVLPKLAAIVDRVTLTRSPNERSAAPNRWSRHFADRPIHLETDPRQALDDALAVCDETLLVCGSLFLVGHVRGLLRQRFGVPPAVYDQGKPS